LHLWRRPWRVVDNRELGGDVRLLTVKPEGHAGFRFEPGQFSWLITGSTPFSREQHPVTIASAAVAADAPQAYAIKRLGDWSGEVVPGLKPGDRLWVEGPYGALSVDRLPAQGFVLIGGGIGITPMLSIIQTLMYRGDRRPVVLFYAANDYSRTIYRDELAEWQQAMDLKVVYVLEHPEPEDAAERGRLSTEILRRHLPAGVEWCQFLVCGPNPMMDAVEHLLGELGVPPDRIHSERFDQV
jgi:predicted ferric reductase